MLDLFEPVGNDMEAELLHLALKIMSTKEHVIKDWCRIVVRENGLSEKLIEIMGDNA